MQLRTHGWYRTYVSFEAYIWSTCLMKAFSTIGRFSFLRMIMRLLIAVGIRNIIKLIAIASIIMIIVLTSSSVVAVMEEWSQAGSCLTGARSLRAMYQEMKLDGPFTQNKLPTEVCSQGTSWVLESPALRRSSLAKSWTSRLDGSSRYHHVMTSRSASLGTGNRGVQPSKRDPSKGWMKKKRGNSKTWS